MNGLGADMPAAFRRRTYRRRFSAQIGWHSSTWGIKCFNPPLLTQSMVRLRFIWGILTIPFGRPDLSALVASRSCGYPHLGTGVPGDVSGVYVVYADVLLRAARRWPGTVREYCSSRSRGQHAGTLAMGRSVAEAVSPKQYFLLFTLCRGPGLA